MSTTLILHQLADKFAQSSLQKQILEAVVFEDDRSFERTLLEEDAQHDILLGGEFGVCLWGLLISLGSRDMWRNLRGLGYDGHTFLFYRNSPDQEPAPEIAGLAQMTVSGASMVLCDVDRLKQLHSWFSEDMITTKAFASGSVSSVAFGLVHGDKPVFDYLTGVWQEDLKDKASTIFYTKNVPSEHAKILEYTSFELLKDSESETKQQRMSVLIDAFMQSVYAKTLPWKEMVERLPFFGQAATNVYLDYGLACTPDEEKWQHNHALFLSQMKNYTGLAALIQRSPLEHVIEAGKNLVGQLQEDRFRMGSGQWYAWQAFIERVGHDAPYVLEDMPLPYRKGEFVSKESTVEKAMLWFETFSFDQQKPKNLQKKM